MALAPDPIHTSGRITDLRAAGPVAASRLAERQVAHRHALLGGRPTTPEAVLVRPGGDEDRTILAALADRDGGRRVPSMPVLIAEVGGVAVAAIGVVDRRVVVDPSGGATGAVALHAAVDRLQSVAAERRGAERRRRAGARVRRITGRGAGSPVGAAR